MKRLFLAVDLSITVVEEIILFQEDLRKKIHAHDDSVDVRWVEAPNIHLTLKFLGPTEAPLISMIRNTVENLANPLFPFEVECREVGCFPSPKKPRIIWAGLDKKSSEVLGLLQQAVERDLAELGIAEESREFKPHITLGRIKSTRAPELESILADYAGIQFGRSYIKDLVLFESILDHRGPRYEVIERFALGSL
ncbi:MAG: RNA 2',3'-cyclic phosphodiesterase [Bradymonadaceae bacterium]